MWQAVAERCLYYNWGPAIPFPASRAAEHRDVWFAAADGTRLHGRWFACPHDLPAPLGEPRPTVLFLHGNAGDVRRWRHIGGRWQDALGAHALVLDYRGYGRSGGRCSEAGFALDARAAYDFLAANGIDPKRLIVCGQSLGGGVAVGLATSGIEHAALVLESTFTTARELANHLGRGWLPLGRWLRDEFPSEDRLRGYDRPLFVSHGDRDWLIPLDHARRLVAAAAGPAELLVVPGLGHYDRRGQAYEAAVRTFLRRHLGVASTFG